jgi:hypothetical protein
LNYGHKYFEDTLFERDKLIKDKLNDCNRLKNQLNDLQLDYDYLSKHFDEKSSELDQVKSNYEDLLQLYSIKKTGKAAAFSNDNSINTLIWFFIVELDEIECNQSHANDEKNEEKKAKHLKNELQQKESIILEKERFIQKLQAQISIIELNRNENEELKNSDISLIAKLKDNYEIDLKNLKGEPRLSIQSRFRYDLYQS